MKNLMLSLIVTVCFASVSMAQDVEKKVVKETISKEVKKCDPNCTKPCCADKKTECKDHKHGEGDAKKCDSTCKKECCAKKGEMKAECKDHKHGEGDAKKCDSTCKKECCAKKGEMKAECDMKKHEGHAKMDGMKCEPGCTKACCADKKVEEVKEVIKVKEMGKMTFACPMKCEGDKTYANEGQCPKCNMNLKPAKS